MITTIQITKAAKKLTTAAELFLAAGQRKAKNTAASFAAGFNATVESFNGQQGWVKSDTVSTGGDTASRNRQVIKHLNRRYRCNRCGWHRHPLKPSVFLVIYARAFQSSLTPEQQRD